MGVSAANLKMDFSAGLFCLIWIFLCCSIPINGQNDKIIHFDAANASTLPRDARQGFVNFDKQKNKYLNVAPINVLQVKTEKVCLLRCVAELQCVSFNFAKSASSSGKYQCELLATDMFNHPNDLTNNANFHHFVIQVRSTNQVITQNSRFIFCLLSFTSLVFLKTKCSSSPCKNNGACIPNYFNETFTCRCVNGSTGQHCENGELDEPTVL